MIKLGIGITTMPNSREVGDIKTTAELIVHNDINRIGVSKSRNNLIKQLYDRGCTHISIVDDDVTFLKEGWFEYAVEVMNNHNLQATGIPNVFRAELLEYDKEVSVWNSWLGCFHIFTRKFIDEVGYFCTKFDTYGYEDSHLQFRYRKKYGELQVPNLLPHYILSQDAYHMDPVSAMSREEKDILVVKNHSILRSEVDKGQIYYPFEQ